jgi:NADH-quinone oxidoreductase subunit L
VKGYVDPGRAYEVLRYFHELFREQFFTEKFYHNVLARGYLGYSKILYAVGERQFIDGIVNGLAYVTQTVGRGLRFLQGGKLNWYVVSLATGLMILLALMVGLTVGGL